MSDAAAVIDRLPMLPRAVLYDWDNTLVDNWGTVRAALNTRW
ncbi:hypothetical protein [Azospirillum sp. TSH58]|nr:hypothetical protein [Azospirillum sp. TSH58]